MKKAIIFRKCLGLNDSRAFASQTMKVDPRDPEAGSVELVDCLNLTTTPDGCLEKIAPFVTALTHSAPILDISAGSRFLFQDGSDTLEWTGGSTVVNRLPITNGPMVHTPIDCRVSGEAAVYKSVNASPAMQTAALGVNPNPATSRTFAKQPAFDLAFVYNAKLYAVNHADPRFLQYSEDYHYDLWSLGDDFIGSATAVLQGGAIPGAMLTLHAGGVTVYAGTGPHDFVKKFYPCDAIDGTLYSGFISKVSGYGHIFLCSDGVYLVDGSGPPVNLTAERTDHLGALNSSYTCATVQEGKYLAFGNSVCVEYDFRAKAVLKRSSFGVKAATVWGRKNYFAVGSTVASLSTEIDTGAIPASMTFPFSDFGAPGTKSIDCFYFTGEIGEGVTITVTDQTGKYWEKEVPDVGVVSEYRIKCPLGRMGNRLSVKIACASGSFRIEELRAVFAAGKRTK